MAHKKGVGSTDNGRDSISKRLGVKLFGGQHAKAGNIIVRQRGTKFHPGLNVGMGKDHTLFALSEGFVTFTKKKKNRTFVSVEPKHIVTDEVIEDTHGSLDVKDEAPAKTEEENPSFKEGALDSVGDDKSSASDSDDNADAKDNLKKVEGIGPKTEEIFNENGVHTFAQLAKTSVEELNKYLADAGSRYERMDPSTWPTQAEMLADGRLDELKAWQEKLDGGRVVDESE